MHRRHTWRYWRCICGQRWDTNAHIRQVDEDSRRIHPGGVNGARVAGWNALDRQRQAR